MALCDAINFIGTRGSRVAAKAKAIRVHLDADPRPFAWVDDHLQAHRPPRLISELPLRRLLIRPKAQIGLTAEHIDALVGFAARHRSTEPP